VFYSNTQQLQCYHIRGNRHIWSVAMFSRTDGVTLNYLLEAIMGIPHHGCYFGSECRDQTILHPM
jgi:hypothetical protein